MSHKEHLLSLDRLRGLLDYDRESGRFTWRQTRSSRAPKGSAAGTESADGRYRTIGIDGRRYLTHRLAWFYVHGKWPKRFIDHENGNGLDNRITNLREADDITNQQNRGMPSNNRCGHKGVILKNGRYEATIVVNGRAKYLGRFDDPEAAGRAYRDAAAKNFGRFAPLECRA